MVRPVGTTQGTGHSMSDARPRSVEGASGGGGVGAGVDDWSVYRSRHGFSIGHPSRWAVTPAVTGMLVSLVAPGSSDVFPANANVVRRVRDVVLDLDGLATSGIQLLQRVLSEPLIIDVDHDVVSAHPARRILVAYRQGVYALTCQQWILLTDEHIWTISVGARSEEWAGCVADLERIGRSFTLEDT